MPHNSDVVDLVSEHMSRTSTRASGRSQSLLNRASAFTRPSARIDSKTDLPAAAAAPTPPASRGSTGLTPGAGLRRSFFSFAKASKSTRAPIASSAAGNDGAALPAGLCEGLQGSRANAAARYSVDSAGAGFDDSDILAQSCAPSAAARLSQRRRVVCMVRTKPTSAALAVAAAAEALAARGDGGEASSAGSSGDEGADAEHTDARTGANATQVGHFAIKSAS